MKIIKKYKNLSLLTLILTFLSLNVNALEENSDGLTSEEMKVLELMCGIKSGQYKENGDFYEAGHIDDYLKDTASDSEDANVDYINKKGNVVSDAKYKIPKNYEEVYNGEPYKEYGINENAFRKQGVKPRTGQKNTVRAIKIKKSICDLNVKDDFEPLYEVKPCPSLPNANYISYNAIMRELSADINPDISHSNAEKIGFPEAVSHRPVGGTGSYMGTIDRLKTIIGNKEICREETYAAEGKRKEYCNAKELVIPNNAWVSPEEASVDLNETMCRIRLDKKIKIGSTVNLNNIYEYNSQMKVMGYATVSCNLNRGTNTPELKILQNDTSECDTSNMTTFEPNSLQKCKNLCVFTDGQSCSPETIPWKSGEQLPIKVDSPLANCYAELPFGLVGDTITVNNQHPAYEGESSFTCAPTNLGTYMWRTIEGTDENGVNRPANICNRK